MSPHFFPFSSPHSVPGLVLSTRRTVHWDGVGIPGDGVLPETGAAWLLTGEWGREGFPEQWVLSWVIQDIVSSPLGLREEGALGQRHEGEGGAYGGLVGGSMRIALVCGTIRGKGAPVRGGGPQGTLTDLLRDL